MCVLNPLYLPMLWGLMEIRSADGQEALHSARACIILTTPGEFIPLIIRNKTVGGRCCGYSHFSEETEVEKSAHCPRAIGESRWSGSRSCEEKT